MVEEIGRPTIFSRRPIIITITPCSANLADSIVPTSADRPLSQSVGPQLDRSVERMLKMAKSRDLNRTGANFFPYFQRQLLLLFGSQNAGVKLPICRSSLLLLLLFSGGSRITRLFPTRRRR